MASWQHGLSRGLGFCSYRPLFIPRRQSLYRNQLINPSSPFLPLFPPFLPPQSSLLSLSWCKGSLPTIEGEPSWPGQKPSENRGQLLSWRGRCGRHGGGISAVPGRGPSATVALCRFQLRCPRWSRGSASIGRTF